MKKIAKLMTALALMAFAFTSCEDVPSPFGAVAPPDNTEDNGGGELPYTSTNLKTGWALVNVTADQPWSQGSSYVQATGYQKWDGASEKSNRAVEGWLISPAISTKGYENVKLSFDHTIKYTNNVSGWEANHKVFVSSDYNENSPTAATWVEITTFTPVASPYSDWTLYSSGELQLPAEMTGKDAIHIGFLFKAPANASTTWELKNFTIEEGIADNNGGGGEDNPVVTDNDGSEAKPYTVSEVITVASKEKVYVKGYIVGYVADKAFSSAELSANATVNTNIILAASADETSKDNCIPIQLPNGAIRSGLNLQDNAGNYKKEVLLYGDITTYFGKPGVKNVSYAVIDGKEIGSKPGSETPSVDAKAVTVAQFNAAAVSTDVWYKLTGTVKNLTDGDVYGNFDLEDETGSVYVYGLLSEKGGDKKKFQELVAAKGIKEGSKITIIGTRGEYNGKIEVMNAYFVSIEGEGGGGTPTPSSNYGTATSPLTVAQAIALIDAETTVSEAYVKGKISKIDSYNATYKSITYWISDDGTTTTQLQVYSGKGLNGADFSSKDDLTVGKTVVIKGALKKYNSTYEFDKTSSIISIDGEGGGGDTPSSNHGTAAAPLTVAQAIALIDAESTVSEAYVKGKISKIDSYNATYKSITYWISDDGTTTTQLQVYSGKGLNGADFTAKEDLTVGKNVVIKGALKKYNSTYEFDKTSSIISID